MTLPDPASVRWHGFGFRGPLNLPVLLQYAQGGGVERDGVSVDNEGRNAKCMAISITT